MSACGLRASISLLAGEDRVIRSPFPALLHCAMRLHLPFAGVVAGFRSAVHRSAKKFALAPCGATPKTTWRPLTGTSVGGGRRRRFGTSRRAHQEVDEGAVRRSNQASAGRQIGSDRRGVDISGGGTWWRLAIVDVTVSHPPDVECVRGAA